MGNDKPLRARFFLIHLRSERALHTYKVKEQPLTEPQNAAVPDAANIERTRELFHDWKKRTGGKFISHAIWADNTEKVLQSGKLSPAEKVLRESGRVSREDGTYDARVVNSLPPLTEEELKQFDSLEWNMHVLFTKTCRKDKSTTHLYIVQFNDINGKATDKSEYKGDKKYKVKPREYFTVVKMKKADKEYDFLFGSLAACRDPKHQNSYGKEYKKSPEKYGALSVVESSGSVSTEAHYELAKKYKTLPRFVMIAVDESRGRPFFKMLSAIYDYCVKKGVNQDELAIQMLNARNKFMSGATTLRENISLGKNRVYWHYGNIAVIKGNFQNDLSLKIKGSAKAFDDDEQRTLAPFQNGGKFWEMDLTDPDVLIIGSKTHLDKQRSNPEIPQAIKDKFVDLEALDENEKALFS